MVSVWQSCSLPTLAQPTWLLLVLQEARHRTHGTGQASALPLGVHPLSGHKIAAAVVEEPLRRGNRSSGIGGVGMAAGH